MKKSLIGVRQTALTDKKILLVYVDVSQPACELERNHLCGPVAGLAQAEALACVALLGADLSKANEAVTLRFRVSGPLAGILVENIEGGGLRGYTHNKVLNKLDTKESIDVSEALGDLGELSVVRSIPGKTISSAMVNVRPAALSAGLKLYYTKSLQRSVDLEIAARSTVDGVDYSRALLIERMPDADTASYKKYCHKIAEGAVAEALRNHAVIEDFCTLFEAENCKINAHDSLHFKCRCSAARVEKMVNALPDEDIQEMLHGDKSTSIICHMCGEMYKFSKEMLWGILEERGCDLDLGEEFTC